MGLAYYIFQQTKFKPEYTSSRNIWASRRTTESKRIPRQRNDFTRGQNLNAWTRELGFFHLMGHVCKSSQGRLLWTVYHHGLHFFAGENTNATLFPSDFLFPSALISPDPSGRKKAMPSSNAFADQMQTEGNFKKYFIFGFLPSVCLPDNLLGGGPKILVQIIMEFVRQNHQFPQPDLSLVFKTYL